MYRKYNRSNRAGFSKVREWVWVGNPRTHNRLPHAREKSQLYRDPQEGQGSHLSIL
jgi:hypothetical protein